MTSTRSRFRADAGTSSTDAAFAVILQADDLLALPTILTFDEARAVDDSLELVLGLV